MVFKHQGIPSHAQRRQSLKMINEQLKMPIYTQHNSSNDTIVQKINAYQQRRDTWIPANQYLLFRYRRTQNRLEKSISVLKNKEIDLLE